MPAICRLFMVEKGYEGRHSKTLIRWRTVGPLTVRSFTAVVNERVRVSKDGDPHLPHECFQGCMFISETLEDVDRNLKRLVRIEFLATSH